MCGEKLAQSYINFLCERCELLVNKHWPKIEQVASELIYKRVISLKEFEELLINQKPLIMNVKTKKSVTGNAIALELSSELRNLSALNVDENDAEQKIEKAKQIFHNAGNLFQKNESLIK